MKCTVIKAAICTWNETSKIPITKASARWNSDWRFLLLGVILLLAVVANRFIRTKAEGIRR